MKKRLLALLVLFSVCQTLSAQVAVGCGTGRYQTEVFTGFTKSTVDYGANTKYNGQNQVLSMDIYEPQGDVVTERPVVILAHGGSFIGGTKGDADMVYFGEHFAKRGFVVASIEYRVGMNILSLDSIEVMKAVVRGVHDMRAAIRYFRKTAAVDGNPHKVDVQNIYIGGTSAGAITALHTAYLDDMNEAPAYLATILNNMGGVEGTSGNAGYSSSSYGVLGGAGALGEKEWIVAGNQPLVMVHGTADDVVPYGTDMQYLPGTQVQVKVVEGSGSIHPYALSLGINSTLKTFNGAGHVPYVSSTTYMDTTMQYFGDFLYQQVCKVVSISPALPENAAKIFPNPTQGLLTVEIKPLNAEMKIYDIAGKCVAARSLVQGANEIDLPLPQGLYFVNILAEGKQITQKLWVE